MARAAKLSLSYERRYGRLTITNNDQEFVVWHSTVLSSSALALLGEAIAQLVSGYDAASCPWEEVPGQYRWHLERQGDTVIITIRWFRDAFSRLPDERGEVVFSTTCPLQRLAVQVKNILLDEVADDPRDHYLPAVLANLDALLQRHKQRRSDAATP